MLPHGVPFLYRPHLDPSLAQFRVMMDGGWVTKVPNGEGFVFIHLKEADWETTRRVFRTLKTDLRYIGDDSNSPTDVAKAGFLAKVTFDNRSQGTFSRDWKGRDRAFELFLSMCHDLEDFWLPRFEPEKLLHEDVDQEIKDLMGPEVEVDPGKVMEKLFLFKPKSRPKERVHGFHVAMVFMTVPYSFKEKDEEGTGTFDVPFPFINPHREMPNAVVDLSFSSDHNPNDAGPFILPPMTMIRTKDNAWMTEGYVRFENPTSENQFHAYVPAIRTKPGPPGEVPVGSLTNFRIRLPGYPLPSDLMASNSQPPVGGGPPRSVDKWVVYSFREEKAQAAWEASPLADKMKVAADLIASEVQEERMKGIHYVRKYANETYLDMLEALFGDENPEISRSSRETYESIVGMTVEGYKAKLAAEAAWRALPLEDKMKVAFEHLRSEDREEVLKGLSIVGRDGNEAYLDLLLPFIDHKDQGFSQRAHWAYKNIVGMAYQDHQAKLAVEEEERQRIIKIARKHGRITNILIKDSVLQRTSIDLGDSGETHVHIQDSVVTRSDIEGKDGTKVKDSVVVGQKLKDGTKLDTDVKVGGPKEGETEDAYEVRLAKYEKALKKAMTDGVITDKEKRLLDMLRRKFGISEDEHEMILEMMK